MCGYCANSMSFRKNRVNWIAHVLTCENNGTKRKTDFNRRFYKKIENMGYHRTQYEQLLKEIREAKKVLTDAIEKLSDDEYDEANVQNQNNVQRDSIRHELSFTVSFQYVILSLLYFEQTWANYDFLKSQVKSSLVYFISFFKDHRSEEEKLKQLLQQYLAGLFNGDEYIKKVQEIIKKWFLSYH